MPNKKNYDRQSGKSSRMLSAEEKNEARFGSLLGNAAYVDDEFIGEHFEGLGNVWHAFFGEDDSIVVYLRMIIEQGELFDNCSITYEDKTIIVLFQYPGHGDLQAGALVVQTPDSDNMEFWSSFPVMEGIPNRLKIRKRHTWENGVEGVVAAEHASGVLPVSFFAPFYFRDFAAFTPGSEKTIRLAALALSCEKAELQEFTVDKGEFYEMQLREFLDGNPGKTKADFPSPVISMRGARILFPRAYVSEWEYRTPILAVVQTGLFDNPVYKLHVAFAGSDGQELSTYLYVPARMTKEYVPQVGDDIQGVLWMTGCLDAVPDHAFKGKL